MVFHWSLSDRKFTQVSRTLLNILADLNNVDFQMVSILPLISDSCRLPPPHQLVRDRFTCTSHDWYHRHLNVPQFVCFFVCLFVLFCLFVCFFFSILKQEPYFIFVFLLFYFQSVVRQSGKIYEIVIFFLDNYHLVWSSG